MFNDLPILFEYAPNHFINLRLIQTIDKSLYDDTYFYHLSPTSVCTLSEEAHLRVLKFFKEAAGGIE